VIGGGAFTSTPDQVNDGTTVGNNGNLKPLGSYPSEQCLKPNSSARHRMTPTWNPGLDPYPQTVGSGVVHLADSVCRWRFRSREDVMIVIRAVRTATSSCNASW
jgi:hypothetical protein